MGRSRRRSSSRSSSSSSSSSSRSRKRRKKRSRSRKDKSRSRRRKSRNMRGKKSCSRSRSRSTRAPHIRCPPSWRKRVPDADQGSALAEDPGNELQLSVVSKESRATGFDQVEPPSMTPDDVEEAARRAQVRARLASTGPPPASSFGLSHQSGQRICVHYLSGFCNFAAGCRNLHPATEEDLHSWKATMFKRSCTYGQACTTRGCLYSHPGQVLGLPPPGGMNMGTPFHIPKLGMLGNPSHSSSAGPGGEPLLGGVPGKPKVCVHYLKGHCASTTNCSNLHASSDAESYTWRAAFHGKACSYGAGCQSRGCLYGHPGQTFGMIPPGGFNNTMIKQIEREQAHYFQLQAMGQDINFQTMEQHNFQEFDQQSRHAMEQNDLQGMHQSSLQPMGQNSFEPAPYSNFPAIQQSNFQGASMGNFQGMPPTFQANPLRNLSRQPGSTPLQGFADEFQTTSSQMMPQQLGAQAF